MIELDEWMNEEYKSKLDLTVDSLVKYLRHYEKKKYEEGIEDLWKDTIGGLDMLYEMLQRGEITVSNYLAIRPAVEYYKTPYEIKIKDNE